MMMMVMMMVARKYRALRLDAGNYAWGSENIAKKVRILDVVYNATSNELVRTKTLLKNTVVQIDAHPFMQYYQKKYGVDLGKKKKGGDKAEKKEEKEEVKLSRHVIAKQKARASKTKLDTLLEDWSGLWGMSGVWGRERAVPERPTPGLHRLEAWAVRPRGRLRPGGRGAELLQAQAREEEEELSSGLSGLELSLSWVLEAPASPKSPIASPRAWPTKPSSSAGSFTRAQRLSSPSTHSGPNASFHSAPSSFLSAGASRSTFSQAKRPSTTTTSISSPWYWSALGLPAPGQGVPGPGQHDPRDRVTSKRGPAYSIRQSCPWSTTRRDPGPGEYPRVEPSTWKYTAAPANRFTKEQRFFDEQRAKTPGPGSYAVQGRTPDGGRTFLPSAVHWGMSRRRSRGLKFTAVL
eukprot:s2500_g2.t3